MKYLLNIIFIASLFLASCQQAEEIPSDLKGKKTYLKTKQAELRELQKKIEKLETEIESIDPEAKKRKTSNFSYYTNCFSIRL
jgi:septal ring factor EnvC (AmiA/AmiB activator)